MINVVYITDEKYILATRTSINSLIYNADTSSNINIYVICINVLPIEKSRMELLSSSNIKVSVISCDEPMICNHAVHDYVSKAALYKFLLPNLLSEVEKVLYLDGDTIIQNDLQELYDVNLDNKYLAAVSDMAAVKNFNRVNYIGNDNYFNSGVMLLNLTLMREDHISAKLIRDKESDRNLQFMDQDTLNRVMGSKCVYISPIYNYLSIYNKEPFNEMYEDYFRRDFNSGLFEKPMIVHLADARKPWNGQRTEYGDLWLSYIAEEDRNTLIHSIQDYTERQSEIIQQQKRLYMKQINLLINELDVNRVKHRFEIGFEENENTILELIQKEDEIMIFGAGTMGMLFLRFLEKHGLKEKVSCFLVENLSENLDVILGVKVKSLNYTEQKRHIVVIAIKGINTDYLKQKGWENIINLNDYI